MPPGLSAKLKFGALSTLVRVLHGYRFTHSVSKTGAAGTGTVLNFGIPKAEHKCTHGDPDPYPWVFQIQNAIPGSMWVSATR